MRVRAIAGFAHSADGTHTRWVAAGEEIDAGASVLDGLLSRRLVERVGDVAETKMLPGSPEKKHRRG